LGGRDETPWRRTWLSEPNHPKAHWEPYLAYWLGGLYVVVEGWREQKFTDPRIDGLLSDERLIDLLKRYRNGAFHYQALYFDERFVALWADGEALMWSNSLHEAFRSWFQRQPETRMDTP